VAIKAFEIDYGANCPKAVAKIVDHADVLLEFSATRPSVGSTCTTSLPSRAKLVEVGDDEPGHNTFT
jgi:hypothetical protein